MPSGTELIHLVPKEWGTFEDICHSLWKKKWNDPEACKHGRRGQKQRGIDIYGRINSTGGYYGVQCKGKDGNLNAELTEKEIKKEVEEAKIFSPAIKSLVIATTAPNDAKAQNIARKISEENEKAGLFSVAVKGWDDIVSDLNDYPEVIDKHYPEHGSTIKKVEQQTLEIARSSNEANTRLAKIESLLSQPTDPDWDGELDKHLNRQVDQYVELINSGKTKTALELLEKLKESDSYKTAKGRTKFRIESNIGSALLGMGDYDQAATYFVNAYTFDQNYIKARCNYAYGLLLQNKRQEAAALAFECLQEENPSKEAASIFILANINNEDADEVEEKIPEFLRSEVDILNALAVYYREKGDYERQRIKIEEAYEKDPDCLKIRQTFAETLIAPIFMDASWVYSKMLTSRYKKDAVNAVRILEGVYEEVKDTEAKVFLDGIAINLCSAYRFIGEISKAKDIIKDTLKLTQNNHDDLNLQLVYIALNEANADLGLEALGQIEKEFDEKEFFNAVLHAAKDQPDVTVKALEKFIKNTSHDDLKVDAFLNLALAKRQVDGVDAGIKTLKNEALKSFPKNPVVHALLARFYNEIGNENKSNAHLKKAIGLLNKDSVNFEVLEVADTCRILRKYDDAANLYSSIVTEPIDHPIFEMYLVSLLNADRRADLKKVLDGISEQLLKKPFIRKIHAIYNTQIGDFKEAEASFAKYIEDFGCDDPDIYLHYLNILHRQDKGSEVSKFLETEFPQEKAQVREIASYYQALALDGKSEKALKIARKTYFENQSDPTAHLGYAGLFFIFNTTGQTLPFLNPEKVGLDTEFTIEDARGNKESFVIEEKDSHSFLANNIIAPSDDLAKKVIGKKIGDEIVLYENEFAKETRKIVFIRHKYIADYQNILDKFNQRFPTHRGLIAFDADPKKDGSFEPIFKSLDKRRESNIQILENYKSELLTLGMVAYRAGGSILTAYDMVRRDLDVGLFCSSGSAEDRQKAFEVVCKSEGYVLDALTIYIIHQLGLENIFIKCSEQGFFVTQTTIEIFNEYKGDVSNKSGGGLMAKGDQGYIWHEYSDEEISEEIKRIDSIIAWINTNLNVLTAVEKETPPELLKGLVQKTDNASYDTILACNGHDKTLLSEDYRLREYSAFLYNTPSTWLQPLLMKARDEKRITVEEYADACSKLVLAKHNYTSVDPDTLLSLLKQDGYTFSDRFKEVLSYLGQRNTEIGSCYHVCGLFLLRLWSLNVNISAKERATYQVLAAIMYERWDMDILEDVVRLLQSSALKTIPSQYRAFSQAIANWLEGHFIAYDVGGDG